jgi:hypothetical protein
MSGPTSTPAPTPRATPSVPPPTLLQPSSDAPVDPFQAAAASKKKKKKKSKPKPKVAKVPMTEEEKEEAMYKAAEALAIEERTAKPRPPVVEKNGVLKISRLKHWKYISAYHVRFCSRYLAREEVELKEGLWVLDPKDEFADNCPLVYLRQGPWLQLPVEVGPATFHLTAEQTDHRSLFSKLTLFSVASFLLILL